MPGFLLPESLYPIDYGCNPDIGIQFIVNNIKKRGVSMA